MKKFFVLCMFLFLSAVSVDAEYIDCYGYVSDPEGQDIENATVSLYVEDGYAARTPVQSGLTDWMGYYDVDSYTSYNGGCIVLEVTYPGYGTARARWENQTSYYMYFYENITMHPTGMITGRVTNTAGDAVTNAAVGIDWCQGDNYTEYSAYTDANGYFFVTNVSADSYFVTVDDANYAVAVTNVDVPPGGTGTVSVVLEEPAALSGTVYSIASGMPVSNAVVKLNDALGEYSSITDTNGTYSISRITPGSYTLIATCDGYFSMSNSLSLLSGENAVSNITLHVPGEIVFGITSSNDDSVVLGAFIQLDSTGNWADPEYTAWSGKTGTMIGNLYPGKYYYRISHSFYNTEMGSVVVGDGDTVGASIVMSSSLLLRGQVTELGTGLPIEGATVECIIASYAYQTESDAFGFYTFPGRSPGDCTLCASHPTYIATNHYITLIGSRVENIEMEPLNDGANRFDLYIQVLGALSGLLLEDIGVALEVTDSATGGVIKYSETLTTDEHGGVIFRGVPEGYFDFAVNTPPAASKVNWKSFEPAPQYIDNSKQITFRLEPLKKNFNVRIYPPYSIMKDPAHLQNFWVEVVGVDSDNNDKILYNARTGLTDKNGEVYFEAVPAFTTRITVRRPGFATKSTIITPDINGNFPAETLMQLPDIVSPTEVAFVFDQACFTSFPDVANPAVLQLQGIKNSNTEGFEEEYSISEDSGHILFTDTTSPTRTAWAGMYTMRLDIDDFDLYFSIPGQTWYKTLEVALAMPQSTLSVIEGTNYIMHVPVDVVPAHISGRLMVASDTVGDKCMPDYRPLANKTIEFVIHEDMTNYYNPDVISTEVKTDSSGHYSVELVPGYYGIRLPDRAGEVSLSNYWGEALQVYVANGRNYTYDHKLAWPYAESLPAGWDTDSFDESDYIEGWGLRMDSSDVYEADLLVRKAVYNIKQEAYKSPLIDKRLVYADLNNSKEVSFNTAQCVEGGDIAELTDGSNQYDSIALYVNDDNHVVINWTNIVAGTYTSTLDSTLLSIRENPEYHCFKWNSPGWLPDEEPPINATPGDFTNIVVEPLVLAEADDIIHIDTSETVTNRPSWVKVYYLNSYDNKISSYCDFRFVTHSDYPGRTFLYKPYEFCNASMLPIIVWEDMPYEAHYSVTEGEWVVDTTVDTPVSLHTAPYDLTVKASSLYSPGNFIDGIAFRFAGESTTNETTHFFSGLTETVSLEDPDTDDLWEWSGWDTYFDPASVTSGTANIVTTIKVMPVFDLYGRIIREDTLAPVNNAAVNVVCSDGSYTDKKFTFLASGKEFVRTDTNGLFKVDNMTSGKPSLIITVNAPGFVPRQVRETFVSFTKTNGEFVVNLPNDIKLQPVPLSASVSSWNRHGSILHGVRAADGDSEDASDDALTLSVDVQAALGSAAAQVVEYDQKDGTPGAVTNIPYTDAVKQIWFIDARTGHADSDLMVLRDYTNGVPGYPDTKEVLPNPDDPGLVYRWLQDLKTTEVYTDILNGSRIYFKIINVTNIPQRVNICMADFRKGRIKPVIAVVTKNNAVKLLTAPAAETDVIEVMPLPAWLAFAANVMTYASKIQGDYEDMKEACITEVPDGKLSALPTFVGGIELNNGYLKYDYGLDISWEEGVSAGEGGGALGLGPGTLGLEFNAKANIGFDGEDSALTFGVEGTIEKSDIEVEDYIPKYLGDLGVSGEIPKISGTASTEVSQEISEGSWGDRQLTTAVSGYMDIIMRYNLEGLTGRIPYIGPFLTLADKANAFRLYARLDAGVACESREVWKTAEAERVSIGDSYSGDYHYVIPDDKNLTPMRDAFGGQKVVATTKTNSLSLGINFATSIEGSALGDHLSVRAGVEITGNEDNDLVAGKPSLKIIPNTLGDWPPIKRITGDVNALIEAKLDAYVTEIEKEWKINLTRIDKQFTTTNMMSVADLIITVSTKVRTNAPVEFVGSRPVMLRSLPAGGRYTAGNNVLAYLSYDAATGSNALMVSTFNGTDWNTPQKLCNVVNISDMKLKEIHNGANLLVWVESDSADGAFAAASERMRYSVGDSNGWSSADTVIDFSGFMRCFDILTGSNFVSVAYMEVSDRNSPLSSRLRALSYVATNNIWTVPETLRSEYRTPGVAMASPGLKGEVPARIVYVQDSLSISSRFWDGTRSAVPDGYTYKYIDGGPVGVKLAMCAGTNDFLYLLTLEDNGIKLRCYTPDPNRDKTDPDYDWNARPADDMWPVLGIAVSNVNMITELKVAWVEGGTASRLLLVWCDGTALKYAFVDVETMTADGPHELTYNYDGVYKDIRITTGNGYADIFARYKTFDKHELRSFRVTLTSGKDNDSDGDGIDDSFELEIVDADTNGTIWTVADVNGTDDFDGDGHSNADEFYHGTDPTDPDSYFVPDGVQVEAAARFALEDGGFSGCFQIYRADADVATNALIVYFSLTGTAMETTDYVAVAHTVTIPPGNKSAIVTITPVVDNLPEGNEAVVLNILDNAGYTIGADSNATVIIKDAAYDQWRYNSFTPQQLMSSVSDDTADPDGDGWPNAMEYAMGTDPLVADPVFRLYFDDENKMQIRYSRSHSIAGDTTFQVIQSTNLLNNSWQDVTPLMPCLNIEATPDVDEIILGAPVDTNLINKAFYRLMLHRE